MTTIQDILSPYISLNQDEWNTFTSKLVRTEYKAKTTLVEAGTISKKIYFIETGLLRAFHLKNGKEISTYFAADNQFISAFASFLTQTPSFESLETVEDSITHSISKNALQELAIQNPKIETLNRILAENNFLCMLDRTLDLQSKTAKEKYLDFIEKNSPKIVQRMPLIYIASFLGIAPESLSRIRKEISIS